MRVSAFLVAMTMTLSLFAAQTQLPTGPALQKICIEPSQIGFSDGEIFANVRGEWIPLEAIYSESGRLLAVAKNPYHNRWHCPECGYNNNGWDKTCQRPYPDNTKCGHPRPW